MRRQLYSLQEQIEETVKNGVEEQSRGGPDMRLESPKESAGALETEPMEARLGATRGVRRPKNRSNSISPAGTTNQQRTNNEDHAARESGLPPTATSIRTNSCDTAMGPCVAEVWSIAHWNSIG
ncbi:hypothetical protein F503_02831 [Ophiostoma piceae UAMH 11346]|uniref:Uncharacterized protein n=1 Tax=Ophiostoma piceae (strain UAMH 11346) TaxID=1262450 RepID=S3BZP9_OPHP1|nr:hypothetical protein F503_02831 [Ophiostoma piceae UAMH 11346]